MKNEKTYSLERKVSLLIFLSLIFCSQISFAGDGDKDKKSKFDLNDPRNPDCPCHKYQKIADEEYFRLLKQQKQVDLNTNVMVNSGGGGNEEIKKRNHSGNTKLFKHWKNKKWMFCNKGKGWKNGRKHRFGRDISSCFHW